MGLPENYEYKESELERAILSHIQRFLLELGRGFSFVARQMRIILCTDKDETIVKYSVLNDSKQIF